VREKKEGKKCGGKGVGGRVTFYNNVKFHKKIFLVKKIN
jgi:hypothetical protein